MKLDAPFTETSAAQTDEDWMCWQLADSAFPSGGFAHSGGLEAAWQHGEARNSSELAALLESSLRQLGHASLPFFNAAHAEPNELSALDNYCDAFLTNHVANRASRLQGRAFLSSAAKIFPAVKHMRPTCGHFAPVFGRSPAHWAFSFPARGICFFFFICEDLWPPPSD